DDDGLDSDFARAFAKEMESFMKDLGGQHPGATGVAGTGQEGGGESSDVEKERLMAAWEAMLVEGMNGMSEGAPTGTVPAEDNDFQKTIRETMDKMKQSEEALKEADNAPPPDSLEALLAQLKLDGENGETEEDFQSILESMMTQLMSKDVLYEPLKELHDKFPDYLAENSAKLSTADKDRYERQYSCVQQIVEVFEDPSYSDEDAQKGTRIVTLMNEMQSHGSPPPEIMGPLPPGLDVGPDGLPKLPDGCTIA
ncbi:Pex19 protein, partial [Punctularia strigosozonata HHB-11173 SS5]|uniref:Pex19 protein n=1 Tax=Punctularia strigosozonata (strain HHB-11173) TaxID=741275 RepID=UPI00044167D5